MISLKLSNGIEIPQIGFGTFKIPDDTAAEAVKTALEAGYRHIDTAAIYRNENGVGKGIKESGIPRNEIFLTSKLWNDDQGYDTALKAFDESLKKLGTDYLDLYLIHWPKAKNKESQKALEKLYKEGKVKAIGLSNFTKEQIQEILAICEVKPAVLQTEVHPYFQEQELKEFLARY